MNDMHQAPPYYFLKLSSKSKHYQPVFRLFSMLFLISLAFTTNASAPEPSATEPSATEPSATGTQLTAADAKKIWDKTCFTCHGDSGDIARNFLTVVDGKLQGPMHKNNLRTFLTNHYLSQVKADAIYSMLLAQAKSKSRFNKECGSCHQKMDDLIRGKLALHNGILYSRKSETPTYGFMETHQNLNKEGVNYFMKKLTFRGYEIYRPVKMK